MGHPLFAQKIGVKPQKIEFSHRAIKTNVEWVCYSMYPDEDKSKISERFATGLDRYFPFVYKCDKQYGNRQGKLLKLDDGELTYTDQFQKCGTATGICRVVHRTENYKYKGTGTTLNIDLNIYYISRRKIFRYNRHVSILTPKRRN